MRRVDPHRRSPAERARVVAASALIAITGFSLAACSGDHEPPPTHTAQSSAPSKTPTAPGTGSAVEPPLRGTVSSPLDYVALGDSYSAGLGGGREAGSCQRSEAGYPARLAADKTIRLAHFAACSGATTNDVVKKQLGALGPEVQLVTLTIGGNDLGVDALPAACAQGETQQCKDAVASSISLLATLPGELATTYQAIAAAAPRAVIVVADYPAFFDLPSVDSDEFPAAVAIDVAVASLDSAIKKAVTTQRETGTDIRFVDVSFAGHGVNSKQPWFVLTGASAYHPTADGYVRYAEAIRESLG